MDAALLDRLAIGEVVNNWVLWSDSGDWERFATVWHDDGWMTATWFQGPADGVSEGAPSRLRARRQHHPFSRRHDDRARRERAIAQTKMTINQRATVDGIVVDAVCTGRFYDFFAKRAGRWAIVRRQPIYEKDRLDPVEPGTQARVSTPHCSRNFPKATATSAICRPKPASTSGWGCRGYADAR